MLDRKLGYIILCFLALLLLAGFGAIGYFFLLPKEKRVIAFIKAGNLRIDDPVRVRGILVGAVKKIERTPQNVYVTIEFTNPQKIFKGYSVINLDQGVMGDRTINIYCGDSMAHLISPRDTLQGTFYPGVSEALSYTYMIKDFVDTLLMYTKYFHNGTIKQKPLKDVINNLLSKVDSLTYEINGNVSYLNNNIKPIIDSLNSLINYAQNISDISSKYIPKYLEEVQKFTQELSLIVSKLDSMMIIIQKIYNYIKINENVLTGNDVEKLISQLNELQNIIIIIQNKVLQFRAYIGF